MRFDFGQGWDAPYVILTDDSRASISFRQGSISLADGEITYGEGLRALIEGKIDVDPQQGGLVVAPSETGKLFYGVQNGRWASANAK